MFAFRLDARSGVPTYRQIVDQVRQAVMLGYLRTGDQLPTVREVAATLAINPNTVAKAYRELERSGLAAPRPGLGTFIVAVPREVTPEAYARLRQSLRRWLRTAHDAGLDPDQVSALFTDTAAAFDATEGVA
ncbi:MAG: GntR family transcriptional regulator [Micromonosporaceae bacterium]